MQKQKKIMGTLKQKLIFVTKVIFLILNIKNTNFQLLKKMIYLITMERK